MSGRAPVGIRIQQGSIAIRVCTGSGCVVNGSLDVANRFEEAIAAAGARDHVRVVRTGCHGLCERGPIVVISPQDIFYPCVSEEMVGRIVERLLEDGSYVDEYLFRPSENEAPIKHYAQIPFNLMQKRVVLRNCGVIDAEAIDDALAHGAYDGLRKTLAEFTPDTLIDEIERSNLRGRGGAGFPTGRKWRLARQADGAPKYVICNADEGDPGAFMDRSVLEGDPHSVLEGMAIAAYAIGADTGYVYVRAEYPLAVQRLRIAIAQAEERGLLGCGILGS
ncbi:MAG: NAD(P)H-dependent oxidoreductase subunit E, partial [Coriobacteriia bacterium]|nr:NAD(P)H-dependent oxidoreductase subunit E [Coriobacteriia bacterium]